MKKSNEGQVWLTKKEMEALTKAFCEVASKSSIRVDQRDVLVEFETAWFQGENFTFERDAGSRFLRLCVGVGVEIDYLRRPAKQDRSVRVLFPEVLEKMMGNPDRFMNGSYWTIRTGNAQYRCGQYRSKVMEEWLVRRGKTKNDLSPWRENVMATLVDEVDEDRNRIDQLEQRIAELERIEQRVAQLERLINVPKKPLFGIPEIEMPYAPINSSALLF
jgi:hypothetical protein